MEDKEASRRSDWTWVPASRAATTNDERDRRLASISLLLTYLQFPHKSFENESSFLLMMLVKGGCLKFEF